MIKFKLEHHNDFNKIAIISTCGFIFDLSRNFRALEEVTIFSKTSIWIPKY